MPSRKEVFLKHALKVCPKRYVEIENLPDKEMERFSTIYIDTPGYTADNAINDILRFIDANKENTNVESYKKYIIDHRQDIEMLFPELWNNIEKALSLQPNIVQKSFKFNFQILILFAICINIILTII